MEQVKHNCRSIKNGAHVEAVQTVVNRIALLEVDPLVANTISTALEDAGYEVDHFRVGLDCLKAVQKYRYSVCILSVMLSNFSGIDVLKSIRVSKSIKELPIICSSCRGFDEDIISALDEGADDYLIMPVSCELIVAKINCLLRRSGKIAPIEETRWGNHVINFTKEIIFIENKKIVLTEKELKFALFLFSNVDKLLTREYIQNALWQHSADVKSRKIDVYISALRKKLMLSCKYGWNFVSVYGLGYRLERVKDKL